MDAYDIFKTGLCFLTPAALFDTFYRARSRSEGSGCLWVVVGGKVSWPLREARGDCWRDETWISIDHFCATCHVNDLSLAGLVRHLVKIDRNGRSGCPRSPPTLDCFTKGTCFLAQPRTMILGSLMLFFSRDGDFIMMCINRPCRFFSQHPENRYNLYCKLLTSLKCEKTLHISYLLSSETDVELKKWIQIGMKMGSMQRNRSAGQIKFFLSRS